ncbi:MAG: ATP-binding protein, partial [Planctomycetota bacterium]
KQSADIRKLRDERALLAATHESLTPLTKRAINDIRKLNENLVGLRAGRDAVATGITLKSASCGVTLDGKEIAVGERAIVTKEARIAVGPHAVIQISPGGGKTLSDLEDDIRKADEELAAKLEKLGAQNLAKAEELLASKEEAKRKMDEIDATLGKLIEDPEQFEEKLSKSVVALEQANTALAGLLKGMATPPNPDGADAARAHVAAGRVQLRKAETADRSARDACDQIRIQSEGDIKTESTLRESISGHKARTEGLKGRIAELVRDLGDETQRQEQSSRLREAATNLRRRAEACSQTAKVNNPDDIRLQIEALERDEVAESRRIDSAQKKRIANQTLLQANGVNDPHEEAALAMARQEEARLAFEAASGKASALLLLENLLTQQKKLINDRQAAPLVNRICGYLTPLFGPGATVEPVWDDKNAGFKTLRLFRPDRPKEGALAVEVLSGGAKEQVGAALRLALAELSLKARDEGITVVLDDAFVNTDSDRARKLMPMLLRASQKGIQVIILSCNPTEYSGLGATRVDMPAPPVR